MSEVIGLGIILWLWGLMLVLIKELLTNKGNNQWDRLK